MNELSAGRGPGSETTASPRVADGYVLCQDCGHVDLYTLDRHQNREACAKCGGPFCGCNGCNRFGVIAVKRGWSVDAAGGVRQLKADQTGEEPQ